MAAVILHNLVASSLFRQPLSSTNLFTHHLLLRLFALAKGLYDFRTMAFAGTKALGAYGELISIGGLKPSVNAKLSSTITDILQTKLSIDSSCFYIKFYDVQTIPVDMAIADIINGLEDAGTNNVEEGGTLMQELNDEY